MEPVVSVQGRQIGGEAPVFIMAEIGAAHAGRVDRALALVDAAAECGVDAVKLQTVCAGESYVPGELSYKIFERLWFEKPDLLRIKQACECKGLVLFSTPGDFRSLDLLLEVGVPLLKLSSGLMTNLPLVRRVAQTGLPAILSTGMSTLDEVTRAVGAFADGGGRQLMLMHCVSLYPAPAQALNLKAIGSLQARFAVPVGYSDHYDGTAACVAAVALGAALLEKHFTLDRNAGGPDDHFSADPAQMRRLVAEVREVEPMRGSGQKRPARAEEPGRERYRRCLVARQPIAAGACMTAEAVGLMRPAQARQGLPPEMYSQVLGRKAARAIEPFESITRDMVQGLQADTPEQTNG